MAITLVVGKGASSHHIEKTSRWDEVDLVEADNVMDAAIAVGYYEHYAGNWPAHYHVIVLDLDGDWRGLMAACEKIKSESSTFKITFDFDMLLKAKSAI